MKTFVQASVRVYFDTFEELTIQVNKLKASGEMTMTITPNCTPEMTTTKQCSRVDYWILTHN